MKKSYLLMTLLGGIAVALVAGCTDNDDHHHHHHDYDHDRDVRYEPGPAGYHEGPYYHDYDRDRDDYYYHDRY